MKRNTIYSLFILFILAVLTGCGGAIISDPTDSVEIFTIRFDSNGGSFVDDLEIQSGERPELPIPEKEGFEFAGWLIIGLSNQRELKSFDIISTNYLVQAQWVERVLTPPSLFGVDDITIDLGETFDPLVGVSAFDETDGDLTVEIQISGFVNFSVEGDYRLSYSVTNSQGKTTSVDRIIRVEESIE
jgi:hypothetical protein